MGKNQNTGQKSYPKSIIFPEGNARGEYDIRG
jgi:hypothetical protein